jgi:endonuclease/exonuclease/phosphatase family metal-dependent hydrolase
VTRDSRSIGRLVIALALSAGSSVAASRPPLAPDATRLCRSTQPPSPPVRWSRPVDDRDARHLDAWCAAVGPLLFRPAPASQSAFAAGATNEVLIASWNVHVGGADIDRFVADLRAGRFSSGHPPAQFVLLLQEAVRGSGVPMAMPAGAAAADAIASDAAIDRNDVERLADRLGLSVFYAPSMRDGRTERGAHHAADRGNAILSTLPLSDAVAIELPGERQRRVAITARVPIDVDGRRTDVSVGVAHLDTLGGPHSLWLFGAARARARQATALANALPAGPTVLGADLNSWMGSGEPAVRTLVDLFPSTPHDRHEPTIGGGLVLDYVLFRLPSGWRAYTTRASERYGSDHYPIVGSIDPRQP